jgi:hypothetical protein
MGNKSSKTCSSHHNFKKSNHAFIIFEGKDNVYDPDVLNKYKESRKMPNPIMQEDWMVSVTFALKNEIYYRHKIITNIKNEKPHFLIIFSDDFDSNIINDINVPYIAVLPKADKCVDIIISTNKYKKTRYCNLDDRYTLLQNKKNLC